METHYYNLSIRVLIYKEGRQIVAHALDLDIPAYGDTEDEAKRELEKLIDNQVSFAACMEKDNVLFPAPREFFDRWEKANQAQLRGESISEKPLGLSGKPVVLVYSQEDLDKLRTARKRDFSRTENLAIA